MLSINLLININLILVNSQSNHYFNFEDDFIKDLRCIPLCVRRKLDLIGIKLKLTHWQDFNLIDFISSNMSNIF